MKKDNENKRAPKSSGRGGSRGNKNYGSRDDGYKRTGARRGGSGGQGFKDSGYGRSEKSYGERSGKSFDKKYEGERRPERRNSTEKPDYRDRDSGYGRSDRGYGSGGERKYSGRDSFRKSDREPYKKRFSDGEEGGGGGYGNKPRGDKNYSIGKVVKKEWENNEKRERSGGRGFEGRRDDRRKDNRYGGEKRGRRDDYGRERRYGSEPGFKKEYPPRDTNFNSDYTAKNDEEQAIAPEIHQDYIIGRKPVLEALRANARIEKIYFRYGQQGEILKDIKTEARKNKIEVVELPESKFSRYGTESNTQGVVALRGMVKTYELEELIEAAKEGNKTLLILDNIQDPQNLGAIIRSAECFGIDGVIITIKNSAPINETVSKVSAGALEYVRMHKSANLGISIEKLKENGFWIAGTTLSDSATGLSVDSETLVAVVMGNEEKGVRQSILKDCDMTYKIPLKGKLQSLNVSVATGVTLFELNRARLSKK